MSVRLWVEVSMSSLELSGLGKSSPFKASGWEVLAPWITKARMEAAKREQTRQQFVTLKEQERIAAEESQRLAREKQQQDSVESTIASLQAKVVQSIQQLEAEALRTTEFVVQIRELSQDPALRGVDLEALEVELVEMEKAVVSIQATTVVNAGSRNTSELAQGLTDARSASVALRTVTARAIKSLKFLEQEIQHRKDEKIRIALAEAARVERAAVLARQQRQLEEQRQAENEWRTAEAARRGRRDLMGKILEVDREISQERRRLGNLRVELANLRFKKGEAAARRGAGLGCL